MKSQALALDTRDDRKEMHQILERLPPRLRVAWLSWCCRGVQGKFGGKVRVGKETTGENAMEIFISANHLFCQYDVDPVKAAVKLEQMAKAWRKPRS